MHFALARTRRRFKVSPREQPVAEVCFFELEFGVSSLGCCRSSEYDFGLGFYPGTRKFIAEPFFGISSVRPSRLAWWDGRCSIRGVQANHPGSGLARGCVGGFGFRHCLQLPIRQKAMCWQLG